MALIPWIQKIQIPLLIDADALNAIAQWMQLGKPFVFPTGAILTPHPKEFERLFGSTQNGYERLLLASKKAVEHQCIIVLKGAITAICLPNAEVYFHANPNPLLATAGSGDVLSGIILSLLAQGYSPQEAALRGVMLHGKAGNMLKAKGYKHALAGDLVEQLAFIE
jgi:NAD(P)H-hydrate epimerase